MDEEDFRVFISNWLYQNKIFDWYERELCNDLAKQFYEDFIESCGLSFGEKPILWNTDLAKRIVDEELAAMEYE